MNTYRCNKCKVDVAGQNTCPLCGNYVGDHQTNTQSVELSYPMVSKEILIKKILFRLMTYLCIISLAVVFLTDFLLDGTISWSIHILVGWILFWLTIGRTIFFHLRFRRQIVWDCIFACLLVVYIEYCITLQIENFTYTLGYMYFIPCIIMSCIGAMLCTMISKYKTWNKYALPTSVLCLISLVPLIVSFSLYGEAYFTMYMTAAMGVLSQLGMMIFGKDKYFTELKKKFHV